MRLFHRKQRSLHSMEKPSSKSDSVVKRPIKPIQITHANPELHKAASLPNLNKKSSKSFKMFHKHDSKPVTSVTDDPKVKKSKSSNFLSKYIKKGPDSTDEGHLDLKSAQIVPPLEFKESAFDNRMIMKPYSVISAPFHEGNLLDKLELPLEQLEFCEYKMNEVPHSTEILNDLETDPNYVPQNKQNESLVTHYHIPESAQVVQPVQRQSVVSRISASSNILQDISSIDLEPHVYQFTHEESAPLMDNRYSAGPSLNGLENDDYAEVSRTKKLSIPNTRMRLSKYTMSLNGINEQNTEVHENTVQPQAGPVKTSAYDVMSCDESVSHSTSKRSSKNASNRNTLRQAIAISSTTAFESNDNLQDTERSNYPDTEFETFKDVKYQVIKNSSVYSDVKIVSPRRELNLINVQQKSHSNKIHHFSGKELSSMSLHEKESYLPESDHLQVKDHLHDKVQELSKPLSIPSVDFSKIPEFSKQASDYCSPVSSPSVFISRDEVYRSEMLSLIETHSLMVNKKQEEINHLRNLLVQERKMNNYLSSPKQVHSRESTPSLPVSPRFPGSNYSPHAEDRKVRAKFIPLDITVTHDNPKPSNYIPFNKYNSSSALLPPFLASADKDTAEIGPRDLVNPALTTDDFKMKPFHRYKVTSPSQADVMHYPSPEFSDNFESQSENKTNIISADAELKQSVSFDGLGIYASQDQGTEGRRISVSSDSSSLYYTAADLGSDSTDSLEEKIDVSHILDQQANDQDESYSPEMIQYVERVQYAVDNRRIDTTPLKSSRYEKRELSGSTTMSSVMTKNVNFSDDSIINTSLASRVTTPDSTHFMFEKN